MTALYIILSIVGLIIWKAKSGKKWKALKDLDVFYYYNGKRGNYDDLENITKLSFNYKRIKNTDPPSETLKKIKDLILKSILELGRTYSNDKNREFLINQYLEKSRTIRRQLSEYYRLMEKIKIAEIAELDALVLTVDSYKEACKLLDEK